MQIERSGVIVMLFILTGDVQTGKTRWLEQLVGELCGNGVSCQGVLAPGVWRSSSAPDAVDEYVDANGFEKLGIDNVLLPQNERIVFARRRDIALAEGLFDPNSQSARANLLWHIDESALAKVNAHLASLPHESAGTKSLLVIDEIGKLELERSSGLVEALRLLDDGPTAEFPHALAIVREALLERARARFGNWGAPTLVKPDSASHDLIMAQFA